MSQSPKTVLTRICLTASSSARLIVPALLSRVSVALMISLRVLWTSNLDRFTQPRVIHPKLVPFPDDLAERLAPALLPVRQENARPRCGERLEPAQQVRLTGMAAEAAEGVYRRADGDFFAEDGNRFLTVHDHSAERAVPLVADEQHGRALAG